MERSDISGFDYVHRNRREGKPRSHGITEIRGPYYAPMGKRYLADILETMGEFVDILKFSGGSFVLMPKKAVRELIELCHSHKVLVSTGGFLERVLTQGPDAVDRYLEECRELGFDIVEVSSGFLSIPLPDLVRLVERVGEHGMKPKPEVGIQFGAGGASSPEELETEGIADPSRAIRAAKAFLAAGATLVMVESEGITESVRSWRTDVAAKIAEEVGLENVMFEAADPAVFSWYVKNFGPDANLFVDHSQVVQLECLRSGIWGTAGTWGRVITYKETQRKGAASRPRLVESRPKREGGRS